MNFIGWIRDLFGIQKDMYETKKTRLEIEKIENDKREKLITPATIEDVKKYDPKTKAIVRKASRMIIQIIIIILILMLMLSLMHFDITWLPDK